MFLVRKLVCLVTCAAIIAGCHVKKNAMPMAARQQGPLVVEGFVVTKAAISDHIEVPGSLLPAEETQIKSEVSGRIVQLNINEGSDVQKGSLLVKLFDEDLQAQLKKLEVQLQIAIKTEERQKELLAINGISQQEYDLTALQVDNLKADIRSVKISISKTEIRAPYNGKIGLRNVSLGSYLSPNDVVATIRQVDRLKLEFSIPEKYAKSLNKGDRVAFTVDGGSRTHYGVVMATESGVDQATRTLRVRAMVPSDNRELIPGIFAKVKLQLGKNEDALLVPTQSVIPQARNKQVVLIRKDSALFQIVETGMRDSVFVEITKGLNVGDTVITTGLMAIRPNAKLKVSAVKKL